ncbi:3-oxoacyl-ACP synthase [Ulvibacterium sp.]|uniref:3-oxoacyl-ACP synthase n=1 Tax=Ulvibacterium sp. TaxID=2665914 RepID=UPI003CC5FC4C
MMEKEYFISSYCHIRNNTISLNGTTLYQEQHPDFKSLAKSAYRYFQTDYSKFFKMDNLSKLGFLAADILLKNEGVLPENEENIAIVLSNRASSLDTDRKHWESIRDPDTYYPSPAIFVYTLPNICIGEISIRHKLYSENSFFIFDEFNPSHLFSYANGLLDMQKAEKVLCGWVDFDGPDYEAFLYLVNKKGAIEHSIEEITRLF